MNATHPFFLYPSKVEVSASIFKFHIQLNFTSKFLKLIHRMDISTAITNQIGLTKVVMVTRLIAINLNTGITADYGVKHFKNIGNIIQGSGLKRPEKTLTGDDEYFV